MNMEMKMLAVLRVLRANRTQFMSPTHIATLVYVNKGADWAKQYGSSYMSPVCLKLAGRGLVKRNEAGRYMITMDGMRRLSEHEGTGT